MIVFTGIEADHCRKLKFTKKLVATFFKTGREGGPFSTVTSAQQIVSFPFMRSRISPRCVSKAQFEDNETNTGHNMLLTEVMSLSLWKRINFARGCSCDSASFTSETESPGFSGLGDANAQIKIFISKGKQPF